MFAGRGTLAIQNIQPTLLLTAFLPVLLFAGALALEWHTVRRLLSSSLLLAGGISPYSTTIASARRAARHCHICASHGCYGRQQGADDSLLTPFAGPGVLMGAVLAAAAVKYLPVRLELDAFKFWVTTALVHNY